MVSFYDLLVATPTVEVQIALAIFHTFLWYFLINEVLVPIGCHVIARFESKKRFIHFNRQSFKKMIKWDIGDDEEEQIMAISRVDAAMIMHLVGGILFIPSAFGLGSMLPAGMATAMASHAGLCEMGWEVQDLLYRGYEIIWGGEKGRKLNPRSLMLTLIAHHSASCSAVIPMNIGYTNYQAWHEGFCIVQLGSFILLFLQQYGYTLDVETKEGLNKMKLAISISFFTCLWTRIIRYSMILFIMATDFYADKAWVFLCVGVVPSVLLSIFNILVMKDAWQKFSKFVSMDIKTSFRTAKQHSKRNIQETIKKIGSIKNLAPKSSSIESHIRSRKLYTGVSAKHVL